ncbi:MAG: hypothetical protein ABIR77_00120 [Sphingomicrobium sp.]
MYAIAFDLDTKIAAELVTGGYHYCYTQIKMVMAEHGFHRVQGSVYFGDEASSPVSCMLAVKAMDERFAWFGRAVKDLRMLRVDEDDDMLPLLNNRLRFGDSDVA